MARAGPTKVQRASPKAKESPREGMVMAVPSLSSCLARPAKVSVSEAFVKQ